MTGEALMLVGARQIADDQLVVERLRKGVVEHGAGQQLAIRLPRDAGRWRACGRFRTILMIAGSCYVQASKRPELMRNC